MSRVSTPRIAVAATLAVILAACGGDSGTTALTASAPSSTPPSSTPSTSVTRDPSVAALFSAVSVHKYMATGPLMYVETSGSAPTKFWKDGPCALGSGTASTTLDGAVAPAVLPVGDHTISTVFSNCQVDGLVGITFTGRSTVAYSAPDWRSVTAATSISDLRGTGELYWAGDLDVVGRGSGTWSRTITGTESTGYIESYSPSPGSSLTSNRTTRTITFQAGVYREEVTQDVSRETYSDVTLTLNGVTYVISGTVVLAPLNDRGAWSGEIQITTGGVLVGRVYGDGPLRMEKQGWIEAF